MADGGRKARTHEVVDSGPAAVRVDGADVVYTSTLEITAHGVVRNVTYGGVEHRY